MNIGGFLPTTLLDYPGKLACTVFTLGCNMRCPFCQNGGLVLPEHFEEPLPPENILAKIRKRAHVLDGVCISGGEPTLQPDLPEFLQQIKALGLSVKLDSNGFRPDLLKQFYKDGLIDKVAMDIKSSRANYAKTAGLTPAADLLLPYEESVDFLMHSGIDYEFRTTLVKGLHTPEDMRDIAAWIAGAKAYYLQSYEPSDNVIGLLTRTETDFTAFSAEELETFLQIARETIPNAELRGVSL